MNSKKPQASKSTVVKASSTTKIPVPGGIIWDYPMPNEDIGISYQEINGRFPKKGRWNNLVCHEIYFVISGSARVCLDSKQYIVKKGDLVIIEPHTLHHFSSHNLKCIAITRPDWYEERCQIVDANNSESTFL